MKEINKKVFDYLLPKMHRVFISESIHNRLLFKIHKRHFKYLLKSGNFIVKIEINRRWFFNKKVDKHIKTEYYRNEPTRLLNG